MNAKELSPKRAVQTYAKTALEQREERLHIDDVLASCRDSEELSSGSGSRSASKPRKTIKTMAGLSSALSSLHLLSIPGKSTIRSALFKGKRDSPPNSKDMEVPVAVEEVGDDAEGDEDVEEEDEASDDDGRGTLIIRDRSKELSKGRQRLRKSRTVNPKSKRGRGGTPGRKRTQSDQSTRPTDAVLQTFEEEEQSDLPLEWGHIPKPKRRNRQPSGTRRLREQQALKT
jgi:hypothetical protein